MAPQNTEQDIEDLFPWYKSTAGPGISSTVVGVVGNLLPMLNALLMARGMTIGPAWADLLVTLAVFGFFSIQALIGYVRAKHILGSQVIRLQSALSSSGGAVLGASPGPGVASRI